MNRLNWLCLSCVLAALSAAQAQAAAASGATASAAAAAPEVAPFDLLLLDLMIRHRVLGIDMVRLARERAQRPEVQALAVRLEQSQQSDLERCINWQAAWYGGLAPAGQQRMHGSLRNLKYLQLDMRQLEHVSGAAFDIRFLQLMVRHHRAMLAMAQQAQRMASHTELRDAVGALMVQQQAEIREMEALLPR